MTAAGDRWPSVIRRALAGIDVAAAVEREVAALPPAPTTAVLAVGKAAPLMFDAAVRALGGVPRDALVIAPDDTPPPVGEARLVCAAHPIPDARSVSAAREAIRLVESSHASRLLVLVSGGASSLMELPAAGLVLEQVVAIQQALLRSGAPIASVNCVRRHLSRIKGGGLVRHARASHVDTVIVSDVIGGEAWSIGSGPSVLDPTTREDAANLVARWIPEVGELSLEATLGPNDSAASRVREVRIAVRPESLPEAVRFAFVREGFDVRLGEPRTDDVDALAAAYIDEVRALGEGEGILCVAEPTVRVPGAARGEGGRSTHLAARVGLGLPAGAVFAAVATDGVDGVSGTGGAWVCGGWAERVGKARIEQSLLAFDTGRLHRAAKSALPKRPTGLNLCDLHWLAREPRA